MIQDQTNILDPWRLALRYNQSPQIRQLYNGLGAFVINASLWDFYKFFDLEEASGVWLNKIGALYNINRPIGLNGTQFVLDVDALDDPDAILDGLTSALLDDFYRRLIQMRLRTYMDFATVDSMSDLFERMFGGADKCRCVIEDSYMSFVIHLYFADPRDIKVLNTVLDINPNVIGEFPGVAYVVQPDFMYPPS